ncbi:MAG: uroporphyrinogen decarboxylase family protein [Spirochaetota bacterium]
MTSRELVYASLEFDSPDRTPRHLWISPWAKIHHNDAVDALVRDFPSDIGGPGVRYARQPSREGDMYRIGTYRDEWGCVFENVQNGVHGEVKMPLLRTWDDLEKVRAPEEMLSFDKDLADSSCRASDKFINAACCPRPFERIQFLRGSENLYIDLYESPEQVRSLIDIVHSFYMKELDLWTDTAVDGITFMDDWGAQNSLLIAPAMWRELFLPLYKDYIDLAHSKGKKAFMHSDGFILDIYPDLIDAGLDAINSQIFCMGVDRLAAYKGKITFWGEIDRQHILPSPDVNAVRDAVRSVRNDLSSNGGVIAQCEFGPGARPENVRAVFETWDTQGVAAHACAEG